LSQPRFEPLPLADQVGELIEQNLPTAVPNSGRGFADSGSPPAVAPRYPPLLHGATPLPSEYRTRQGSAPTVAKTWHRRPKLLVVFLIRPARVRRIAVNSTLRLAVCRCISLTPAFELFCEITVPQFDPGRTVLALRGASDCRGSVDINN